MPFPWYPRDFLSNPFHPGPRCPPGRRRKDLFTREADLSEDRVERSRPGRVGGFWTYGNAEWSSGGPMSFGVEGNALSVEEGHPGIGE